MRWASIVLLGLLLAACGGGSSDEPDTAATTTRAAEQTEVAGARVAVETSTTVPTPIPPTSTAKPDPTNTPRPTPTNAPRPTPTAKPPASVDDNKDLVAMLLSAEQIGSSFSQTAENPVLVDDRIAQPGFIGGITRTYEVEPSPPTGLGSFQVWCAEYRGIAFVNAAINNIRADFIEHFPNSELAVVDIEPIGDKSSAIAGTITSDGGPVQAAMVWVRISDVLCQYIGLANEGTPLTDVVGIISPVAVAVSGVASASPTPTATVAPQPTYTPVSREVFAIYFGHYVLDSADYAQKLGAAFAVPEADRGQFWLQNLEGQGKELRDQYDLVIEPMTSLNSPPTPEYAILVQDYQAALKTHADGYDAYIINKDLNAYKDVSFVFIEQLSTVINDLSDYEGY